jgi:hypothetical protein
VTLPAAAPGLTTGAILAVARGAGETAPLIMTALGARQVVLALTGAPQADIGLLMLRRVPPAVRARHRAGVGRRVHPHRDRPDHVHRRAPRSPDAARSDRQHAFAPEGSAAWGRMALPAPPGGRTIV